MARFLPSKSFAVNVLSSEQQDIAVKCSPNYSERFADVFWYPVLSGVLVVAGVPAYFECETSKVLVLNSRHRTLVSRVHDIPAS